MLIPTEDIQLNVEILGEDNPGTPVVLLHCVGGDLTNWYPQARALAQNRKVVLIDSRGHGQSEFAGENLALEDYAADVRRVFDALDIDKAIVGGLSMGGMITQAFALTSPDRIAGLVLADTSSQVDEATAGNLSQAGNAALQYGMGAVSEQFIPICFKAEALENDVDYVQEFRAGFTSRNPQAFHAALEAIGGLNFTARLGGITVPTLVLVGTSDMLLPVQHSEVIAEAIPNARLVTFDGAGHLANLDSEEEFTKELEQFVGDLA